MLIHLSIQNFAIVKSLEVEWRSGMTTITGETGAGKSIAIDALGLCLGDRAVTNVVRPNCKQANLVATFDISKNPKAINWLTNNDFSIDDECILRRVISSEGRSKSYINGTPVPLAQLKDISQLLINIHGQHDHQLITKSHTQKHMLDAFANHHDLLDSVKFHYQKWQGLSQELATLQETQQSREAQQQLLQYQVNELDDFSMLADEFTQLEQDYKKYSNCQHLLDNSLQALHLLNDNEQFNINDALRSCIEKVAEIANVDQVISPVIEQMNDALLQLEDASQELQSYHERLELDPEHFQHIEDRYSTAIQLAKKHQTQPEALYQLHHDLKQQLTMISSDETRLTHLHQEIDDAKNQYLDTAKALTQSRQSSAEKLSALITDSMRELNMEHGQFNVAVNSNHADKMSATGSDDINFLVSLNPGQSLDIMSKVASGGELSRISLALQVILSHQITAPSLIFDEVDVGISGPTAAMVGTKLQQLAANTQVICVTHLPQVASKGHQQLFVSKLTDGEHTETNVTELSQQARVQEIARLLAGDQITDSSLANAQELLAS
ncbi:DNA repair protein RecN [Thalassotalea sp. 1_MG-2023]|uniref:DNA repair protein RecN n=1 Tax=Thalassotalea sp. 1_MG-2023 TaxID=3062680 RepID=UPI0026E2BBB8|nr:DNA repair protein RecN [Thalassotalea sp. 1_MG-2023]MDO6426610.1 DNA repair protein RecN [Thalassotalea sp. 1_MG-2023]